MTIRFGTDGWRGIISFDFTFQNLYKVVWAIAQYMKSYRPSAPADTAHPSTLNSQPTFPILIGYDTRFLSAEFANFVSNGLWDFGIPSRIVSGPSPTPAVAFTGRLIGGGAIMITASHNPPEYSGIKFIPEFGGPAPTEVTDRIGELIEDAPIPEVLPDYETAHHAELVEPEEEYFQQLRSLVNAKEITRAELKVLYNPLWATGSGYLDQFLESLGVRVTVMNGGRDVMFGGSLPDPSESNTQDMKEMVKEGGFDVGIATDGDADRIGVITPRGQYLGANQILPLLARYLKEVRGQSGRFVRTVATSHMIDRIASKLGEDTVETAVGFKYVAKELMTGALIGGEESGGISIQGHIPEKDGILSGVLICEMIANYRKSLDEIYDDVSALVGKHHFKRLDFHLNSEEKSRLFSSLKERGSALLEREIDGSDEKDGLRFFLAPREFIEVGSPRSQPEGTGASTTPRQVEEWILFRPSGTEDVVRVYFETGSVEALEELSRTVNVIVDLSRSQKDHLT